MNAHQVKDEQDRAAVELVFTKLCRLYDAGRDHLWSYYIRNLSRPLSFTRADGRVNVLVGNPPWLAYRFMTPGLQATYQALAAHRGMWVGGRDSANQDLSDLFVARAVEQYLRPGGSFAFVMPYAVLSRFVYAGFRTGDWSPVEGGDATLVAFKDAEEFAKVKPPLFPVPSCVVSGAKAVSAVPLTDTGVSWSGRVDGHHLTWDSAVAQLTRTEASMTHRASRGGASPYRARFQRGATLFPRALIKVTEREAGPLGAPSGLVHVVSSRTAVEKQPWKSLASLAGSVEQQFVRPTHLGASIVSYRSRQPEFAIVPWLDGALLDGEDERLDEFPGLAAWWRDAERLWHKHKADGNALSLRQRIDFQRGVSNQFPVAEHRVVYTNSGQYLSACRLDEPSVLVEQTLLWANTSSAEEARYLCAIFNSDALAQAVLPLQSRGQHNPRHFAMSLFSVPFPAFDESEEVHARLAALAEHAEQLVATVDLDASWQFQKARRVTREALREDGVANEIDETVGELLAPIVDDDVQPA